MIMDDSEIERIYSQQLHEELLSQTRLAVTQFIELCPDVFGLENLILQTDKFLSPINERVAQLYQDVCETYIDNGLPFDHAWVKKSSLSLFIFFSFTFILTRFTI
jgi:hypothetical protein